MCAAPEHVESPEQSAPPPALGGGDVVLGALTAPALPASDFKFASDDVAAELEALRREVWRFRALTDTAPVGVFRTDASGETVYLNPRGAEMVGLPPREALGRGWVSHVHPDDLERVITESRAARVAGRPYRAEYRFVHRDGRVVWVLVEFIPDRDPDGRVVGVVGTMADVTALKAAEGRARHSEHRYQALAENSAVGIWHISPAGSTLYLNPAMRRMLELDDADSADDLVSRPDRLIYEFFPPESRERMRAEHLKRPGGASSVYEVELVGKHGRRRNVLVCGAPLLGGGGELLGMIATFIDVTDRRRVEEALRQNEARLRLMSEQVPAVFWTTDAALRFTSSFGAGLAAIGLRAGQTVGLTVPQFFGQDGPADSPAVEAHRRALSGVSVTYEQLWAGRAYHCHVEPLRSGGGGADASHGPVEGVVGIALDITDRKKAEDALREARDWLEVRVKQRTEELTRANEALRREVEERKAVEERLRQSQARYASILNSQQTLVSRSDPQGRITYVNAAHQRTFGSQEGDSVFVNVHPDDVEATLRAMEDLVRAPFTCTLEQRCEVRGRWRTFLWQVGVIRDRLGQIIEYQGVGFDVTDQRRAEELLLESTRRARDSAEQARAAAQREREAAVRERRAAEEARQVAEFNRRLALEVDHRVRNNLAGLMSLIAAMRESARDVKGFADAIEGRLLAMAHAHALLAETDWKPVDLGKLVASLLSAVERLCPNVIDPHVAGPAAAVSARQAPAVAMILMEWFNNSCKYGAHSVPGCRLDVTWQIIPLLPARGVRLRWRETGGPPPRQPVQPSLGTELVKGFASVELHGSCELRFPETGADHLLEFPLADDR